MIRRDYGRLAVIGVACAVGSFLATYVAQQPRPAAPAQAGALPLTAWLGLSAEQNDAVSAVQADFDADRAALEARLGEERARLATLLEDTDASDAAIVQQVERVIAAHNALERRVAELLVALRPHLTAAQRDRLLGHFATSVREAGGWRWRHGAPEADGAQRPGGPPAEHGRGRGRGGDGDFGGRGRRGANPSPAP